MFKTIFEKEFYDKLITMRFSLLLLLAVILSVIGTFGFNDYYLTGLEQDGKLRTNVDAELQAAASQGLGYVLALKQSYYMAPRLEEIMLADSKVAFPKVFPFSAGILELPEEKMPSNPFFKKLFALDWYFLVAVLLSFLALALAYDTVSGEKLDGTLALTISNSLDRSLLLLAKYAALMIVLGIALAFSILIGLITSSIMGLSVINPAFLAIVLWFFIISIIYLSIMVLLGILVSIVIHSPPTGMVVLLSVWVIVTFLIPGTGRIMIGPRGGIITQGELKEKIQRAQTDYSESIPRGEGPLSAEVRAEINRKFLEIPNRINTDYANDQISRVDRAAELVKISPASALKSVLETINNTGLTRYKRIIRDIPIYQNSLKNLKNTWSIPRFKESPPGLIAGVRDGFWSLFYLLFLNLFLFSLCWIAFVRADVR